MLCDLLTSTNRTGAPHSFYRRQDILEWAEEWKLPDRGTMGELDFNVAYLNAAVAAGKGGTGVFGLRLMRENLDELSAILDRIYPGLPSDKARFEKAFGRVLYMHLSREDKLAQAVSLIKAEQTGLWHVAPDGTEIERVGPRASHATTSSASVTKSASSKPMTRPGTSGSRSKASPRCGSAMSSLRSILPQR